MFSKLRRPLYLAVFLFIMMLLIIGGYKWEMFQYHIFINWSHSDLTFWQWFFFIK